MLSRSFRFLSAAALIGILMVSSLLSVRADDGVIPGVCYVVEIGYTNIGPSEETVTAYVIRFDTGEHTTSTFTFTLKPGASGTFRLVFLIPDPVYVLQFLDGTYYKNPNMVITDYNEDYLDIQDCTGHLFEDGRINDGENEKAAPVVAYCEDEGIGVYDIDAQSNGNFIFRVSYDDVSDGLDEATSNGTPVTLGSGNDDTLYALPSGELQLSGPEQFTGKPYNYIFAGDFCG